MKPDDSIKISDNYSIEWGTSSWDEKERSVRNRYKTSTGGFSPRSSSELPMDDLEHLIVHSAQKGHLSTEMMSRVAKALIDALAARIAAA